MPTHAADKKGRRKRKSRTAEVESPSSSSGESDPPSPSKNRNDNEQTNGDVMEVDYPHTAATNESTRPPQQNLISNQPPKPTDPEQAFDEFYLKQATKEFENDLDKLRSASDFKEGSVQMLIEALRQGRACFSVEERGRIGGADD